jgi:hypothetical protein
VRTTKSRGVCTSALRSLANPRSRSLTFASSSTRLRLDGWREAYGRRARAHGLRPMRLRLRDGVQVAVLPAQGSRLLKFPNTTPPSVPPETRSPCSPKPSQAPLLAHEPQRARNPEFGVWKDGERDEIRGRCTRLRNKTGLKKTEKCSTVPPLTKPQLVLRLLRAAHPQP